MANNPQVVQTNLSDTEREVLVELLESPTWSLIINKVARPMVDQHISTILGFARGGSSGAFTAGKIDGISELLSQVYLRVNQTIPNSIKQLARRAY